MRARYWQEGEDFWPAYADILMVSSMIFLFIIGAVVLTNNTDDVIRKEIQRREAQLNTAFLQKMGAERAEGALSVWSMGEEQHLVFSDTKGVSLLFGSGSDSLNPRGLAIMGKVAGVLKSNAVRTYQTVEINGYTDMNQIHSAKFPSNWYLSSARATTVLSFLISRGLDPRTLSATGFGEFHPVDPGRSAAAFAKNRRIEIVLLYPEKFVRQQIMGLLPK